MYNIKSVAKLLDMPAVTIRAWERRYQVVAPIRSESGHRLYSEQDIEDLRWLKVQTEERGVNISQAVKMLEKIREKRSQLPAAAIPGDVRVGENMESIRERLYEALLSFDVERGNQLLSLSFSMYHLEDVFHNVMAPLLEQVRQALDHGIVTVAQEHFVVQFIMMRFFQFFNVFGIHPGLPKAVAFCPVGEQNQVSLLLFTLFLRRQGVEVIFLGPNTPTDGLQELIQQRGVDWACISIQDPALLPEVEALMQGLQAKFPQLEFVLVGQGFAKASGTYQEMLIGGTLEEWRTWYNAQLKQRGIG